MEFRLAMKLSLSGFSGVPFLSLVSRHSSWRCALSQLSEPHVTLKPVKSGPEYEKHQKKKENLTQNTGCFDQDLGFSDG